MQFKHVRIIFLLLFDLVFSQSVKNFKVSHSFPFEIIQLSENKYSFIKYGDIKPYFNFQYPLTISYNSQTNFINGHKNIDNYGALSSIIGLSSFNSISLSYQNKWLFFRLEPFVINNDQNGLNQKSVLMSESFQYLNHHSNNSVKKYGLRQSGIFLSFFGTSIGFSNFNQWWGPSFHNSINISSNPNGMKTFMLGTIKDKKINDHLSYGIKTIVSPYKSIDKTDLYLSALSFKLIFDLKPKISIGFNRTYYSGNFSNLSEITSFNRTWTGLDAYKLLFEPLFGQNKKGEKYTSPGTPGFDPWDEFLSGYINLEFPAENINIYLELASDDNRANFNDLRAHWDHTLGYIIGINKIQNIEEKIIIFIAEYTSLLPSNTFNPIFFRGGANSPVYYTKNIYDYSSYDGKLIGAHSGTSSDDLMMMFGFGNSSAMTYFAFSKERHGVKTAINHELKNELSVTYDKYYKNRHKIFVKYEFEKIYNYGFTKSSISTSNLIWFGYSFLLK